MPNLIETAPLRNPILQENNRGGNGTELHFLCIGVRNVPEKMYNFLSGTAAVVLPASTMAALGVTSAYLLNNNQSASESVFNEEILQGSKKMTLAVAAFMAAWVSSYFYCRADDIAKFPERMMALPAPVRREIENLIRRGDQKGLEQILLKQRMLTPFLEVSRSR